MIYAKKYASLIHKIEPYTNQEYLNSQILLVKDVFYNELVTIKNANLEYQIFSNKFADTFGLDENILGKTILDIPDGNRDCYLEIMQQEKEAITKKLAQDTLFNININNQSSTYLMRKRPLINPATQDSVGIIVFAIKTDAMRLRRLLLKLHGHINNKDIASVNITEFSPIQQQIITCLLLGFHQHKEITLMLQKMSQNQIGEHVVKNTLHAMYKKYECSSSAELLNVLSHQEQLTYKFPEFTDGESSDVIITKSIAKLK